MVSEGHGRGALGGRVLPPFYPLLPPPGGGSGGGFLGVKSPKTMNFSEKRDSGRPRFGNSAHKETAVDPPYYQRKTFR